jgi:hypothetical protein
MPSRQTTLKEALRQLARQTDYSPVINYENTPGVKVVNLTTDTMSAAELLRQVLEGTGFTYRMMGRLIIVVPEPPLDDGAGAMPAMWHEEPPPIGDEETTVVEEVITFRAGSSEPDPEFMDNSRVFTKIEGSLVDTAVVARLDYISVTAASSPDGNPTLNARLATERAQSTKGYLIRRFPHIAPEKVHTFSVGEEWSGLRRLVEQDTRTPDREGVLAILDTTPDEALRDTLQTLGGGRAWRHISARLMPRLRGSTAVALHFGFVPNIETTDVAEMAQLVQTIRGDRKVGVFAVRPTALPVAMRPLFALKTNLLFDATGAVNVEMEVPIERGWSVAAEGIFPWKMMVGWSLEWRNWWGNRDLRPVLTGWFTGFYTGSGMYDMQIGRWRYDGKYFHVGVSGGYGHAIDKGGVVRMEYSLGLGYLQTEGDRWRVGGDGRWNKKEGRFGPTRAKVSLSFLLSKRER